MSTTDKLAIATVESEEERLYRENNELRDEVALLRDKLLVAKRRLRVLRGSDVLTSASSRGIIIWLQAILGNVSDVIVTRRHLEALVKVIRGDDE